MSSHAQAQQQKQKQLIQAGETGRVRRHDWITESYSYEQMPLKYTFTR